MRYMSSQLPQPIRLVGLSHSLANARDVGEWLGAAGTSTFNFAPGVRPVPLEIHMHGLDIHNFEARMQVGVLRCGCGVFGVNGVEQLPCDLVIRLVLAAGDCSSRVCAHITAGIQQGFTRGGARPCVPWRTRGLVGLHHATMNLFRSVLFASSACCVRFATCVPPSHPFTFVLSSVAAAAFAAAAARP